MLRKGTYFYVEHISLAELVNLAPELANHTSYRERGTLKINYSVS